MKLLLTLLLAVTLGGWWAPGSACAAAEEAKWIAVLQGSQPPEQKDAACVQLKRIGTAAAVPALARLLTDPQLAHSARYALESLPGPEATAALVAALADTEGPLKAGVLQSLGERPDAPVAPVARCLAHADAGIAAAAARALGKIGTAEAVKPLLPLLDSATGPLRAAVVDALLMAAEKLRRGPDPAAAARIGDRLTQPKESPATRQAAWCGLMRTDGKRGLNLLREGLLSQDEIRQRAALQVAGELKQPDTGRELAALLPKLPAPAQAAVIDILRQRGERDAVAAITRALESQEAFVRVAALHALGELGDASAAPALLEALTGKNAEEQTAARRALARLRGPLADVLLTRFPGAPPALQAAITQTLAARTEKAAVPRLLELARTGPEAARPAALRAAAQLADAAHLGALVDILQSAATDPQRAAAHEALLELCRRVQAQSGFQPAPLLAALRGEPATRAAVYPVLAQIRHEAVRAALLNGRQDADPQARAAALRALCETVDPALAPELVQLAKNAAETSVRVLAVRGAARLLAEEPAGLNTAQRAALLRDLFTAAPRPEEQRLVLARLATAPTVESLQFAAGFAAEPALQNEAAQAVLDLTGHLSGSHAQACMTALQTVLRHTGDDARKKAAQSRLQQIEALADYLTAWRVAGPYEQTGKTYNELFDTVFPPEQPNAAGVAWKPLPAGTDPQRPFALDLLKALGGEQRVAYVRTRVFSDAEQAARLELGSDDGVKVWLNGRQVYAHNTARALTPGSDKVEVKLSAGWNTLLLKITQNNQGWEFSARLLKPDGARLPGLKVQADD